MNEKKTPIHLWVGSFRFSTLPHFIARIIINLNFIHVWIQCEKNHIYQFGCDLIQFDSFRFDAKWVLCPHFLSVSCRQNLIWRVQHTEWHTICVDFFLCENETRGCWTRTNDKFTHQAKKKIACVTFVNEKRILNWIYNLEPICVPKAVPIFCWGIHFHICWTERKMAIIEYILKIQ